MASVRQLTKANAEGKRPWVVEYTDKDGNRKRSTPKSGLKRDAEELKRKIERDLHDGLHTSRRDGATVAIAAEEYLKAYEHRAERGNIRNTTYNAVASAIKGSIVPMVGHLKLSDLTARHVEEFYQDVMKERRLRETSARAYVKILGRVEAFGRKRGYTKLRVVADTIIDLPKSPFQRIKQFSVEDVQKLLHTANQPKPQWSKINFRSELLTRCVVNIMAYCGLRIGEVMGLATQDVDFERRRLNIRQSVNVLAEVGRPKTPNAIRSVPMPLHVAELLADYFGRYLVPNERNLVFSTREGLPFRASNFWVNNWRPLLDRAGLLDDANEARRMHALRHFAASWMIENGLPIPVVSKILGHASPSITLKIYAHAVRDLDKWQGELDRVAGLIHVPSPPLNATKTRLSGLSH